MRAALDRLFELTFGLRPVRAEAVAGDGSPRTRLRLFGPEGTSAIGVPRGPVEEDAAFLRLTRAFLRAGLPVPELYAVDDESGAYLLEDAGRENLFAALERSRRETGDAFPSLLLRPFRDAIRTLPRFQVEGGRALDAGDDWPRSPFDRRAMGWDLAYFKNCFLRLAEVPYDEDRLEDDFDRLLDRVLEMPAEHFLYRDFQARNVMLTEAGQRFLDYQGGRRGPLPYDVASMLYSGSTRMPDSVREELLEAYLESLKDYLRLDEAAFRAHLPPFAVLRILQALGAYGYRGLYLRRTGFAARIGNAVESLARILGDRHAVGEVAEIRRVVDRIATRQDLVARVEPPSRGLVVRVGSFAYARGVPRDPSGHGGGFVFDCRALPNPGREERYRSLSGLDPDVQERLASEPATAPFLAQTTGLVTRQVAAYVERGFTSLDVRFGCTGGQHRSVYCAERLARHLRAAFPEVEVRVEHAEAESWPLGAARPAVGSP